MSANIAEKKPDASYIKADITRREWQSILIARGVLATGCTHHKIVRAADPYYGWHYFWPVGYQPQNDALYGKTVNSAVQKYLANFEKGSGNSAEISRYVTNYSFGRTPHPPIWTYPVPKIAKQRKGDEFAPQHPSCRRCAREIL